MFLTYVLLAMAVFCLPSFAAGPDEFHFRAREDLGTLDWGNGEVNSEVVVQLMEGLTTINMHSKPQPALAQQWRFSSDKRKITFNIRRDAHWSDGKPVCAEDFVNAWTRAISQQFQSPYAHYFFSIRGAKAFHAGKTKTLTSLSTNGCKTLHVELENPAAYFPALVSHWLFLPVRNDELSRLRTGEPFSTTGPYTLAQWKKETSFTLQKNMRYYDHAKYSQRPEKLVAQVIHDDNAALNLFQTGGLDWARELPFLEKRKLATSAEFKSFPALIVYYLGFRMQNAALSKEQRCLLANALNKSQIPKLFSGLEKTAYSLVPPELGSKTKTHATATPVKKTWPGPKQALELYYYSKDIHAPLMEWLQSEFRKNLGIEVQLRKMEGKAYWSMLQQSPPAIFLSGTTAAYAHPYAFLSEFLSQTPANWGHFASVAYNTIAEKTAQTETEKSLTTLVAQAEDILLNQECAAIPLYFRNSETLVSKKWSGFEINSTGIVYLKKLKHVDSIN